MKRRVLAAALALMMTFSLAACGAKEEKKAEKKKMPKQSQK